MVLVMWIDALRQANMCCASLSPLFAGYALKKRKTSGFASWLHASLSIWLGMMRKSLWFCISNAPYSSIQYSVIHCQSITTDTEEVGNAIFKMICMCTNEVVSCLLSKFLKSPINRNANQCVMYLSKALMSWKHDNLFSHCPQQGWITPVEMTHLCLTSPWSCACCMHKVKDCLCCLKERFGGCICPTYSFSLFSA